VQSLSCLRKKHLQRKENSMLLLVSVLLSFVIGAIYGAQTIIDAYKKKAQREAIVEFDGETYKFVKVGR